jgi:orotate phosphoribosyltransferase
VVAAAGTMAPFFDLNLKGLLVRKEKKEHGLGKIIEGPLDSVKKVVVVEDVVTTGNSLLRACKVLDEEGVKVLAAIPLVDRQEEDIEPFFEELGVKFNPLITVNELL